MKLIFIKMALYLEAGEKTEYFFILQEAKQLKL